MSYHSYFVNKGKIDIMWRSDPVAGLSKAAKEGSRDDGIESGKRLGRNTSGGAQPTSAAESARGRESQWRPVVSKGHLARSATYPAESAIRSRTAAHWPKEVVGIGRGGSGAGSKTCSTACPSSSGPIRAQRQG